MEKYAGLRQSGDARMRRPGLHGPRRLRRLRNLQSRLRPHALAHPAIRPGASRQASHRSRPRLVMR